MALERSLAARLVYYRDNFGVSAPQSTDPVVVCDANDP